MKVMSDEELAVARRDYPQASASAHMLVDGRCRLRCQRCRERPVPTTWAFVALCDECLAAASRTLH